VLQTAAVLATDVAWPLLTAATGRGEEEVAAALRAGVSAALLVHEPGASLRWRHALTRDAVLADLLPPERAAIAGRAATALGTGELSGQRARLVAELYAQSGREVEAAPLLLALARAAAEAGALGSAEEALRRAAGLDPDDLDVVLELVGVLGQAGRIDEATALGSRILDTIDAERLTTLCLHLARAAVTAERWAEANRFLARVAGSRDPRVEAVRAHIALGEQDSARAAELARKAAADGERTGRPEAVCEALEILGRALRRADPDTSEAAFAEAERHAERHGLIVWRVRALFGLGIRDVYRTCRVDRLQEAQRLALDAGMLGTVAMVEMHIGTCVAVRDGHVAMLPFAERAMAQADRLSLAPIGAAARFFAALGCLFGDDQGRVEPLLVEARALAPDSMDIGSE
jgi:tetratricopeptide (TPR) repeat protein